MKTVLLKCVTIVAESVLADRITTEIKALGASGYTLVESSGEGSRHLRAGEIPGRNVRIDAIVSQSVADAIVEHVASDYFENYAVIVYITDVHVVRGEKYV